MKAGWVQVVHEENIGKQKEIVINKVKALANTVNCDHKKWDSTTTCSAVAIYAGPLSLRRSVRISVKEQVTRCWNFSNKQGWKVASIFVDQMEKDRLVRRTNFRTMLEEARTGNFATVIFCRLEYFCGSQADFIAAEKSIRKSRITFHNAIKTGGLPFG
jgi:hypothetical protein